MSAEADLLAAVLADPADDAPRLVLADFLDEAGDADRAEFVRLQVRLARLTDELDGCLARSPRHAAAFQRERELLEAHGERWRAHLPRWPRRVEFRRGFVEGVTADAQSFLDGAEDLAALTPLSGLRLTEAGRPLQPLTRDRSFGLVRRLDLLWGLPIEAADLEALADSPYCPRLRELSLFQCGLSGRDLEVLAAADEFAALRELELGLNGLLGGDVRPLFASPHLPGLRRLGLSHNDLGTTGVETIASAPLTGRLTHLDLSGCRAGDAGAAAIAASPRAARLRVLLLNANGVGNAGARALADSPLLAGLRVLSLAQNAIGSAGAEALAASPHLAGLEMLDLVDNLIPAATRRRLGKVLGDRVAG